MKRLWFIIFHIFLLTKEVDFHKVRVKRSQRKLYNVTFSFFNEDTIHYVYGDVGRKPFDYQDAVLCVSAATCYALGCYTSESRRGAKRLGFLLLQRYFDPECMLGPANLKLCESLLCLSGKQHSRVLSNVSSIVSKLKECLNVETVSTTEKASEKGNRIAPCSSPSENTSYSWIFQLHGVVPKLNLTVAPSNTLSGYFKDVLNGASTPEKMRYEWARYETFKTFPQESPARPIRLARAGFYYSNCSDEVTCFSCNLRYRDWQDGDIPSDVHVRRSPSCRHAVDNDPMNVPIHEENNCSLEMDVPDTAARSNGYADCAKDGGKHVDMDKGASCAVSSKRSAATHNHPDMADMGRRLDTLGSWNNRETFDIREIAKCGYFYSSTGKCLRCYSCGAGVRDLDHLSTLKNLHTDTCTILPQPDFKEKQNYDNKRDPQPLTTLKESVHQQIETDAAGFDNSVYDNTRFGDRLPSNQVTIDSGGGARRKNSSSDQATQDDELTAQMVEMGFTDKQIRQALSTLRLNGTTIAFEDVIEVILKTPATQDIREETDANTRKHKIEQPTKEKRKMETDSLKMEEEYTQLRQQLICKICMDQEACMVIMPCGHISSCPTCTLNVRKCPICRKLIKRTIKMAI